jgi:hypothetical protein
MLIAIAYAVCVGCVRVHARTYCVVAHFTHTTQRLLYSPSSRLPYAFTEMLGRRPTQVRDVCAVTCVTCHVVCACMRAHTCCAILRARAGGRARIRRSPPTRQQRVDTVRYVRRACVGSGCAGVRVKWCVCVVLCCVGCVGCSHSPPSRAQWCARHVARTLSESCADVTTSNASTAGSVALRATLASLASAFIAAADTMGGEARHCGTTALLVWLDRASGEDAPPDKIHVGNLGDTRCVRVCMRTSRAVLGCECVLACDATHHRCVLSRAGRAVRLSMDHKPIDDEPVRTRGAACVRTLPCLT